MSLISQPILQRVAEFIAQNHLLSSISEPVYVGLSGGPDSVALLHILCTLGYPCKALHCNFHLRNAESDRDQRFCEQLCRLLNVPLQVQEFDTLGYMQEQHLSLEMAARQLRYRWWKELFDNTANEDHPTSIALGHHQDDSIETLLMNLMRGTGIQGLTGIVVFNEQTHVIRPLLCLSRHDIMDYLRDNDLSYVIDSTNSDNDTLRNQIRNQLLPLMEQLVPQTRQGISQTMEHLSATAYFADRYLGQYDHLTKHFSQWGMEWDELSLEAAAEQFPEHLEDFLHAWQTRHTATNCTQVVHTPNLLYTAPIDEAAFEAYRPTLSIETTELTNKGEEVPRPSSPYENSFDADTVTLPLTLRRWQEGDRISPLGMKGRTKLVSDLFSNAHYRPMQKATTWLVCDATGAILWVIGLRMSDKHKITPATTRILRVTCR